MKAAVFTGVNEPVSIEDVSPIDPGPHDVVVRIGASGVCHSDLSIVDGTLGFPPPVIIGHEGAGTVESVGSAVTRVKVGDVVISSFVTTCGECWYCHNDQPFVCAQTYAAHGTPHANRTDGSALTCVGGLGTMAEFMTVSERVLVPVRSDLPMEQLALIGCGVTTGVGAALVTANVQPGSTVAVVGCGGVGQSVIQGARIAGAARIIAVDLVEMKRKTAEQFGATDMVAPAESDAIAQVKALTGGRGVDYSFEVIGLPETITQAHGMARNGGTVCVVGMTRMEAQITLSAFALFYEGKTIVGSKYGSAQVRRDFQRFVDLIESGRLDTSTMVSRTIKLDEVNDAFRAMEAGEVIRSVIV